MIKLQDVKVEYPNFSIGFKETTLPLNKVTFVTGRNGVGKTTLLKAIAKLLPYEGTIEYEGFATYHFQEPILFHRSVKDNILYPIKIRKKNIEDYQEQLLQYASILHIDHLLDRSAKLLSSGEKMKASLLRSILFQPEIILLDEPTNNLDLESIDQLIELIKTLKQDMTFVIVSHNRAFIDALSENIYHLGGTYVHR